MKKIQYTLIITLILFSSCSNNPDINIICNTDLTEGKETLYFEGDYGDIEQFFDFEIYKHKYNVEISFDKPIINSYKGALRNLSYYTGETPPSFEDHYNLFLNDDQDLYLLYGVLETLKSRSIGTDYDIIQMIVGFVQTIPYDEYAADVNYPYETLAFNKGDCDEKSILLCKLLNLAGYDACLFIYEKERHMAVGLKVAESGYYKNGYVFIESTNTFPIGMRGKSADGKESKEEPLIIYAEQNEEGYYEQYLDIEECYKEIAAIHGDLYLKNNIKVKNLIEKMNVVKTEIDSININRSLLDIKLTKYANEIDSLNKIINEKYIIPYPAGIPTDIYDEYTLVFNERKKLKELRNDIVNDYNNMNNSTIFDEYNKLIKSLNQAQQEKSPSTRTILDFES